MNLNVIEKDIKSTPAIEEYAEKKLERIQKYFEDEIEAEMTLRMEGNIQIAEIKVFVKKMSFRAISEEKDIYESIDKTIDILEGQIRKAKTIREKKRKEVVEFEDMEEMEDFEQEVEDEIIKYATYELKPLDPEDAKMILSEQKNIFMTFVNINTNAVNVIFKLKDGKNYGLIEPEQ